MGILALALAVTGGWTNSGWATNPDLLPGAPPIQLSVETTSFEPEPEPEPIPDPEPLAEPDPEPAPAPADPPAVVHGRFDGARYYLADRYGREWQSTDWPQLWAWVQTQNMSVPQYQPVYQQSAAGACQTVMDPTTGRLYQTCPR